MIEVETHLAIIVVLVLHEAVYVHNTHELAPSISTLTPQPVINGQNSLLGCYTVRHK